MLSNDDIINNLIQKELDLTEKNKQLDIENIEIDKKLEFQESKQALINRLKGKIAKMSQRKSIVEMKYSHYKKLYDLFNIFIIIISSVLTIIEAIRNDINVEEQEEGTKQFLKMAPLVISTLIGLITAIMQFKKFQEKLDSIARTTEKSIFTIYRMKKLIEELTFTKEGNFDNIKQTYLDEIFTLYNQNQAELEKKLNVEQLIKYTNKINQLEIIGDRNNLDILIEHNKLEKQHKKFEEQTKPINVGLISSNPNSNPNNPINDGNGTNSSTSYSSSSSSNNNKGAHVKFNFHNYKGFSTVDDEYMDTLAYHNSSYYTPEKKSELSTAASFTSLLIDPNSSINNSNVSLTTV